MLCRSVYFIYLAIFLLQGFAVSDAAERFYRWVDEAGNIYYSDKLPPDQVRYRREKLDQRGITVEVTEAAKSAAEIQRDRQLQELRKEQARLLAEQSAHDQALLRSFRSEHEIRMALEGKLETLTVQIKVAEANNQRLESLLRNQQKKAAAYEKKGLRVSESLLATLLATRHQIEAGQQAIARHEAEKAFLRQRFSQDIERFRMLTAGPESQNPDSDNPPVTAFHPEQPVLIGLYVCDPGVLCDQAWVLARRYLIEHATTPLRIDTSRIVQTAAAGGDGDISLSITKISGKQTTPSRIFMDARCKSSSIGQELCASAKVRTILAGFRPYIEAGLGASAPQQQGADAAVREQLQ